MNVWGVTFGGYLPKILSFKSGNLLYKSNFYLLSEGTLPRFLWFLEFVPGYLEMVPGYPDVVVGYLGGVLVPRF